MQTVELVCATRHGPLGYGQGLEIVKRLQLPNHSHANHRIDRAAVKERGGEVHAAAAIHVDVAPVGRWCNYQGIRGRGARTAGHVEVVARDAGPSRPGALEEFRIVGEHRELARDNVDGWHGNRHDEVREGMDSRFPKNPTRKFLHLLGLHYSVRSHHVDDAKAEILQGARLDDATIQLYE